MLLLVVLNNFWFSIFYGYLYGNLYQATQRLNLIADIALPGMSGARTTDIAAIQKNILSIKRVLYKKIYSTGDIRNTHVLVVTDVFQFVCIINIRLLELTGFMLFINTRSSELAALDIVHALCPSKSYAAAEMEDRFLAVYGHIKYETDPQYSPICFICDHTVKNAELVN